MGKLCTVLSKALLFSMKRLNTVIIMVFLFWLVHASENSLRVKPVFPSAAYFPSSHVMKSKTAEETSFAPHPASVSSHVKILVLSWPW